MKSSVHVSFASGLLVAGAILFATARSATGQLPGGADALPPLKNERSLEASAKPSSESRARAVDSFGRLPLSFEANQEQTDPRVKFLARGQGYTLFLTHSGEAVLTLAKRTVKRDSLRPAAHAPAAEPESETVTPSAVVRMSLAGANRTPQLEGANELPGKANYFIGNDPHKWRTNVPTYARVNFHAVYPGVDLAYYGNQQQLEYDFILEPGGDSHLITMNISGAKNLSLDAQGDLVLRIDNKDLRLLKPMAYQEVDGQKREVASSYELRGARQVGFQVAAYDHSRPLVIDPVLAYSTYFGGSGGGDIGYGIAVDAAGNAYVTGLADSIPTTPGAFQTTAHAMTGAGNAFVTKLNPAGSALVYSTYLGGSGSSGCPHDPPASSCTSGDQGAGIAVDAAGNAYVTGWTSSSDFPTTLGAFQPILRGLQNAFATKLSSDGTALLYATYLGGSDTEWGFGVAIDSQDNAYVTGATCSNDFPVTSSAFQSSFQRSSSGTIGAQIRCVSNAFVSKLNSNPFLSKLNPALPEPVSLVYSTYLGGASGDAAYGIAVDSQGNAYVTGQTYSTNFPVTPLAFQMSYQGSQGTGSAFVSKLNPGDRNRWSTLPTSEEPPVIEPTGSPWTARTTPM